MINKNKENKLEKKSKLYMELMSLVPFFIFNNNFYNNLKNDKGEFKKDYFKYDRRNTVSSIIFGAGIVIYSMMSFLNGTLNYQKWPEATRQREIKKELQIQKDSHETFSKYDLNSNGKLDSTEFYNYHKSKIKL